MMNWTSTRLLSSIIPTHAAACFIFDAIIVVLALYAITNTKNYFALTRFYSRLTIQCAIAALVLLSSSQSSFNVVDYLRLLALVMLPLLLQHHWGNYMFQLASVFSVYRGIYHLNNNYWQNSLNALIHGYLIIDNLDSKSKYAVSLAIEKIFFLQEINLIRLGKLRGLVLNDIQQLPDRMRLEKNCSEFKYNVNEPLFLIRAIIRMIWRPLLLPYLLLLVIGTFDGVEIMVSSYVIHCIDTPSEHQWYHGYVAALILMAVKIIRAQNSGISEYANNEISHIIDKVGLEVQRLPLGRKNGTIYKNGNKINPEIIDLMERIQDAKSIIFETASFITSLWIIYLQVGWLAFIPLIVPLVRTFADEILKMLFGPKWKWRQYDHHDTYDDSTDNIFRGIKPIKMFAWERMYLDLNLQNKEDKEELPWYTPAVRALWYVVYLFFMISHHVASYLVIHIYTNGLSPEHKFTSADMFQLEINTQNVCYNFEGVYRRIQNIKCMIDSNNIIERYLRNQPNKTVAIAEGTSSISSPSVLLSNCSFTWTKKTKEPVIKDISLSASSGELVAVVGKIGSGKSSLLLSICSELEMVEGEGLVTGSIGYLEQSPWIMNDTLRANIIFGREFEKEFFDKVVDACAFTEDISQWPQGDLTVIGERGVNISGGQRARLALARTIYSRADIYVLDDPLSAVDAHVKKHILDNVLLGSGLIANKLRIVSTNDKIIPLHAHQIVSLEDCTATVKHQKPQMYLTEPDACLVSNDSSLENDSLESSTVDLDKGKPNADETKVEPAEDADKESEKPKEREWTYWENALYVLRLCGLPVLLVIVLSGLVSPIKKFMFKRAELSTLQEDAANGGFNHKSALARLRIRMTDNVLTYIIYSAEKTIKKYISNNYIVCNVQRIFLESLIYAPMSFYDSTTRQHVSSAFNNGARVMSTEIPMFLMRELSGIVRIAFSIYQVGYNVPHLMVIVPLIAWITSKRNVLIDPTKDMIKKIQRETGVDRSRTSDIIADGKRMIRLFGVETHFMKKIIADTDEENRIKQPTERLQSLSYAIFVIINNIGDTFMTFLMLFQTQYMGSKMTSVEYETYKGLLESLVNETTAVVNFPSKLRSFSDNINMYRRFTNIEPEAPYTIEETCPSPEWPQHGNIEFRNFSLRYREDLDPTLNNINLTIKSGEKIGIVGRTGAGKTSLVKSLFRLSHKGTTGSIIIDGQDISTLGVGDLRPRLGIIPQESTMFPGTYKKNLDPLREFTSEDIWAALLKCDIASKVSPPRIYKDSSAEYEDGVSEAEIEEYEEEKEDVERKWAQAGPMLRLFLWMCMFWPEKPKNFRTKPKYGLNKSAMDNSKGFSDGQQQLFSLCRILLRKRRIIVLDEATADVDLETDQSMQQLICKEFSDSTIITIAHRLETVMHSDRIIVMDKGQIAEIGPPQELIEKGGWFAELVRTSKFGILDE